MLASNLIRVASRSGLCASVLVRLYHTILRVCVCVCEYEGELHVRVCVYVCMYVGLYGNRHEHVCRCKFQPCVFLYKWTRASLRASVHFS